MIGRRSAPFQNRSFVGSRGKVAPALNGCGAGVESSLRDRKDRAGWLGARVRAVGHSRGSRWGGTGDVIAHGRVVGGIEYHLPFAVIGLSEFAGSVVALGAGWPRRPPNLPCS